MKQLSQGPRTALQLAASLDIQVSAARKHLVRLHSMGIVEERFERSGPGRPKKFYRLSEEGRELFPRNYDALLNDLLSQLERDHGDEYVEGLFGPLAEARAASIEGGRGTDPGHLKHLVTTLGAMGFDPTLQVEGGVCTITSHNCPILRTAKAHKELVCRGLHAEIIRRATGSQAVVRGKWMPHGDPVCTHQFPTASKRPRGRTR